MVGFVFGFDGARRVRRGAIVCRSDVVVVGGGIGGLAAAVAVKKATGKHVKVLERSENDEDSANGVSISVWPNAWKALDAIDSSIADKLRQDKVLVSKGKIVQSTGKVLSTWKFDQVFPDFELRAVPRAEIIAELLRVAHDVGVEIVYNSQVQKVEASTGTVFLEDGSTVQGSLVVGADGIRSRVRDSLIGDGPPVLTSLRAIRGVADLDEDMEPEALQVWDTESSLRFGSVPITRRTAYWFVTTEGGHPGKTKKIDIDEPLKLVRNLPPEARNLVERTPFALLTGVADRLPSLKWGSGKVTLLGDAAHPMLPNLGQGAAAALEDAISLAASLKEDGTTDENLEAALRSYEESRRVRASVIQLRSRAISTIAHWDNPIPAKLVSTFFNAPLIFRYCNYEPPVKLR